MIIKNTNYYLLLKKIFILLMSEVIHDKVFLNILLSVEYGITLLVFNTESVNAFQFWKLQK